MVKNLIFNCDILTRSDRDIIHRSVKINLDDNSYELYTFYIKDDEWDFIDYNHILNRLLHDNNIKNYFLI